MSLLQWPFKRKQYAGVNNPRFVSDIVAANEAIIDGLIASLGLNNTDFYIINGIEFDAAHSQYSAGTFYLNGQFYYISTAFATGLYLIGSPSDTLSRPFPDAVSRNIYTVLSGVSTSVSTGSSPIFTGDMNAHRIGNKKIKTDQIAQQSVLNGLGNSSTRDVGVTAGTVMAGDNTYTKTQIDSFTVKKLASGIHHAGDVATGGTIYTISLGTTIVGDYIPVVSLLGASQSGGLPNPINDVVRWIFVYGSITSTEFKIYLTNESENTQDIYIKWLILSM